MNLNIRGYFILSQHIGKHSMIPRRSGRIINLASIAGLGGNPREMTTLAYNTSKGAVINFTRALGCEWGAYNITVNAICPGFFPSRMTKGTLKAMGEDKLAAHAPLGRLGDDEDLKGLCVLYASDAGKHITGQWLAVDGGVSAISGGCMWPPRLSLRVLRCPPRGPLRLRSGGASPAAPAGKEEFTFAFVFLTPSPSGRGLGLHAAAPEAPARFWTA